MTVRPEDEHARRQPSPPQRDRRSDPPPHRDNGGRPEPDIEAAAEGPHCLLCGALMVAVHCKLICPECGYREDCSDLFPTDR